MNTTINTQQLGQIRTIQGGEQEKKSTGTQGSEAKQGISGEDTITPDTGTTVAYSGSQMGQLVSALSSFQPEMGEDFEVLLAQISAKMKDVNQDSQTEQVMANQEIQQLNTEENAAKA